MNLEVHEEEFHYHNVRISHSLLDTMCTRMGSKTQFECVSVPEPHTST